MIDVISLGAGVQSTTLALMATHGEITPMPEAAIFADTGAEPREVYEHLKWLDSMLPFPVITTQFSDMLDDMERTGRGESQVAGRAGGYLAAPFFTKNEDGSHGMLRRECTKNYKIRPINRALKELLGLPLDQPVRSRGALVRQWLGISADEVQRVNWSGPKWLGKRFPFLGRVDGKDPQDLWMTRNDCLRWLADHDYPIPARSACTFCPYRSNAEWRHLRDHSPQGWGNAVRIDRLIRDMPDKLRAGLRKGGKLYVHASRQPLEDVVLDDDSQPDLWSAECEGMCGT